MSQYTAQEGMPTWLKGCAIGCAIVAVAGIVGAVAIGGIVYFGMNTVMEEGKTELVKSMQESYAELKAREKIPAEHQPAFDELVELSCREETGMFTATVSYGLLTEILADGTVSEQEKGDMDLWLGFLRENPDAGMMQVITFVSEHPQFQNRYDLDPTQLPVSEESDYEEAPPSDEPAMEDEFSEDAPATDEAAAMDETPAGDEAPVEDGATADEAPTGAETPAEDQVPAEELAE